MFTSGEIVEQTKKWIKDVVVGCNFCPFAASALKQQAIRYQVEESSEKDICIQAFENETKKLDTDASIETSFVIFPNSFQQFSDYLPMIAYAEQWLVKSGYAGVYQVASFHPQYLFSNADETDAANYTNRSIYPMLHLLRESSIDKVLEHYTDPENIPGRNIAFARKKGIVYMQMLRDTCMQK